MSENDKSRQIIEEEEQLTPEKLFRPIDAVVANAKPLEPLWGYFLYRKAVTSIVGDPGVAKTTFGYSLGFALSHNVAFLNIAAECPVKILYLDFESADSLIKSRKILITEEKMPNFFVYNSDYYLPQISAILTSYCQDKGISLVIIDNQTTAFGTRDENDNSEAARQMRFIRGIAQATNTAIILFHHTSKANLPGTRKGTGAYARARLADVCINIDWVDKDSEIISFETVKNRMVDERTLWYLKRTEGKFVFTSLPLNSDGRQPTNTAVFKAQEIIMATLEPEKLYKNSEILAIAGRKGIDSFTIGNALKRLCQQGRLKRPEYGYYERG